MDNILIIYRGRHKGLHTCYANVNNINKVSNVRCAMNAIFANFSCATLAYMKLELLKLNPVISF
jgi:hypothetical protein